LIFKGINLKELFQLMQENDIDETMLQDGKTTVSVKRNKEPVVLNKEAFLDHSSLHFSKENKRTLPGDEKSTIETEDKTKSSEGTDTVDSSANNRHKVLAPLVGTFYRAPSPDSEPFVEVGDQVNPGDVLCIVEAMKSMNEIQSDVKGIIKEICIENAQLVEFEQPMFHIEPN